MNVADKETLSRRTFLKGGAAASLTLTLSHLMPSAALAAKVKGGVAGAGFSYASWEDLYRGKWSWDKVSFGSHTNACIPSGCLFHVYSRNGIVWREEQAGKFPVFNKNYPDANPMGCQKGCGFSQMLYSDHRVTHPLKRMGARGEGKWKRVSWDEALTEIADAILDAHQRQGPDAFIMGAPHGHQGAVSSAGVGKFSGLLNCVTPDITAEVGDCYTGILFTLGKIHLGYSMDNVFDAELLIVSHSNPSYTYIPNYHYFTEARYNGTEIAVLSPEYTPHLYADTFLPVKVGSDAALWMAVCQVIIEEKLYQPHVEFVREQTDMPLLVRTDTQRYLRESDLKANGKERQLYVWDGRSNALVAAPRATLAFAQGAEPALEGEFEVTLADGSRQRVRPVFEVIKESANKHRPEAVESICNVVAPSIRELARKIATKRTCCWLGFGSGKFFHGDLSERSLLMAMALTGNWGKPGTGINNWSYMSNGTEAVGALERPVDQGGLDDLRAFKAAVAKKTKEADPDSTEEDVRREVSRIASEMAGIVPATMFYYKHAGYDKVWDNKAYADPVFGKTYGEALEEGIQKGWWKKHHLRPAPGVTPEVYCVVSANPMRRLRSGAKMLPESFFPKLKMFFAIEPRMSATAAYADIVLPAAWYYEKHDKTGDTIAGQEGAAFIDAAVAPVGEAKPEWEIYGLMLKRISERARARGMTGFTDSWGQPRTYAGLYEKYSLNGHLTTPEDVLREIIKLDTQLGTFSKDTTYETFKKDGWAAFESFGESIFGGIGGQCANEYDKNKPYFPMRWHVDNKQPYPTYARRAQFYLEQEWFIAAGEAAPTFKDIPPIGGDYPFRITGGHPRHSVHTIHQSDSFVNQLHRAQPVVHINDRDAVELGISDGEMVVLYNDLGESQIMARVAPGVQPRQLIVYLWEATMFKDWKVYDSLLVGMPKTLWLAGDYEQFSFIVYMGAPSMASDRGVRIGLKKIA